MKLHRHTNLEGFLQHRQKLRAEYARRDAWECGHILPDKQPFHVPGFSLIAGQAVDFLVSWEYSSSDRPNWREWIICPISGLNNRLRASYYLLNTEFDLYQDDNIYTTEQLTPLYTLMKKHFPNTIGSEFFGEDKEPGSVNEQGIRHEDLTKLSFPDESMKLVTSFDCFEHMPEHQPALQEAYRILQPGGTLFFTVPFAALNQQHILRASIDENGNLVHHLPPEYHGDPINSDGCLCFRHFGWDMLDDCRSAGFDDVYVITLYSAEMGHLGPEQLFFVARKNK